MKQLFLAVALMAGVIAFAAPTPEPTEKVLKAFKETFAFAKDITWHNYSDFVQANFNQNKIQVRAQFSDDGTLIKTIRYYGETELQPNILAKLKKKHTGKEIFGVTETMADNDVQFIINLRDNDNWYTVRSDIYGNLETITKFKRADNK